MFRKVMRLAVAIVLVMGCNKKTDDEGGIVVRMPTTIGQKTEDAGGGTVEPEPSGPEIWLRIRRERKGDKFTVNESSRKVVSVTERGTERMNSKLHKETQKAAYTETIVEMTDSSSRVAKAMRDYRVAERSEDGGPAKPMSCAMKTVLIEKKGSGYTFTANGSALPTNEAKIFPDAYEKLTRLKNEDFVLKHTVKVNEKWYLDSTTLRRLGNYYELPINALKSSGIGRLTKIYTKNGQLWGTIQVKVELVVDGIQKGLPMTGTLGIEVVLDAVIDGSSLDSSMNLTITGKIISQQAVGGVEFETTLDLEGAEARTTVK